MEYFLTKFRFVKTVKAIIPSERPCLFPSVRFIPLKLANIILAMSFERSIKLTNVCLGLKGVFLEKR
jgi:hypothetical protein